MKTLEKRRVTRHQLRRWGLAAGLLVIVACIQLLLYRAPLQPEAYFQRVLAAEADTPTRFGPWVSVDTPVPPAAVTMLKPNLTVSRRYTNLQTGEQATFLLVQCSDATYLSGHYPPNCYVSSGFKQMAASPKDWQVDGLTIHGMVYRFTSTRPEDLSSMIIYDFMILPDGQTCRDMAGVNAAARDPRRHVLGAAQMQVLVDPSLPESQRDALFFTMVQAHRRVLDAILAGDQR